MRKVASILVFFIAPVLALGFFVTAVDAKAPRSSEEASLFVLYGDLGPYLYPSDEDVGGYLSTYLKNVFSDARIKPVWNSLPFSSLIEALKNNRPNICVVGFTKTPERETYMKFTSPIGHTDSIVVLAKRNDPAIQKHQSIRSLLSDYTLHTLVTAKRSYGTYIDTLFEEYMPPQQRVSINRIAAMLHDGTIDYSLQTRTFAKYILKQDNRQELQIFSDFSDIDNNGFLYHLACSESTSETMISRLNRAIEQNGLSE